MNENNNTLSLEDKNTILDSIDPCSSDIQKRYLNDQTPLMIAASLGKTHLVSIMIHYGAKVNAKDQNRKTALMYAAETGMTGSVKQLLKHRARFNKFDDSKMSALMYASRGGFFKTVYALLQHGADPNRTKNKKTALMYAATFELNSPEQLLLDLTDLINSSKETEFTILTKNDYLMRIFQRVDRFRCIFSLLTYGADVNAIDKDGFSALSYAVNTANIHIVITLQANGFTFDTENPDYDACLQYAMSYGGLTSICMLVNNGADTSAYCSGNHLIDNENSSLNYDVRQAQSIGCIIMESIINPVQPLLINA